LVFDTTLVYPLLLPLFNNLAGISTGTVPPFFVQLGRNNGLELLHGLPYRTSNTFGANGIFGKVYFLEYVPISIVISNLLKFGIQFCIFIAFYLYYYFQGGHV
jgi:lipopolysaccharide transport system permease protein